MGKPQTATEERFGTLIAALISSPGVTHSSGDSQPAHRFGSDALKVHGKIFAMLLRGRLVLKLPKARVDELATCGDGERFDPRRDGRVMKEWMILAPSTEEDWLPLAQEALEFVRSPR